MKCIYGLEAWYPVVNGKAYFDMGGFNDPISAEIVAEAIEDEIKRMGNENLEE